MSCIYDLFDEMNPDSHSLREIFKDAPLKSSTGVPEVISIVSNPRSPKNFTEIAMMQLREKAFGGFRPGEMMIYSAGPPSHRIKEDFERVIRTSTTDLVRFLTFDSYNYTDYQLRKDFDIFPLTAKEPSVSEVYRKNWVSLLLQKERQ